ncbi:hypothetical protein [Quadrisphaera sp. DSM 44207]|uniref:hypothetical protein n=1 Tax=Quadrisphaera sp. DSM 44207 TaxID=1881057 RepID=UPI000887B321|nr:hypothetical protein [Quadrisphaera sp. DSM 44207]SDQ85964.1 hypothetical protein SAMN05428996_2924 [Quadrisphaera sp. DSM 44207]
MKRSADRAADRAARRAADLAAARAAEREAEREAAREAGRAAIAAYLADRADRAARRGAGWGADGDADGGPERAAGRSASRAARAAERADRAARSAVDATAERLERLEESGSEDREGEERRGSGGLLPLALGLGAGVLAAVALAARSRLPQPLPANPTGRVGEPGPQWTVEESVVIHQPAGTIAAHLHEHGGLPGLRGPLDGPPMDRIDWEVPGEGLWRVVVHGLPGADHTEVSLSFAPQAPEPDERLRAAVATLAGANHAVRARAREALEDLRRTLERRGTSRRPGER